MVKTTTIESFQAADRDDEQQPDPPRNYLADLAERMVRDREGAAPHVGDPFEGMSLDVDPADAFGLVEGQVRAWLSEAGRWATEIDIKHKTDQLMAEAQNARPGPVTSEARYSVAPDGTVTDYQPLEAPAELPEMPAHGLRVPKSTEFDSDGWADSTALYQRAQALIERHPDELEHLEGMSLSFLWKLKGGKSRGRPIYGQCVKAGGLLKHFATSTFLIWLAADHVLAARYGDREIEALLFRQLLAAGVADVDENTGRGGGATLVPPDVQAYAAELRVYGLWESTLKSAAQAFRQAPLFTGEPSDFERQESQQAGYAEDVQEEHEAKNGAFDASLLEGASQEEHEASDTPSLACSICGAPIEADALPPQDAEIPAVVLCEACGEDGIIEDEAAG